MEAFHSNSSEPFQAINLDTFQYKDQINQCIEAGDWEQAEKLVHAMDIESLSDADSLLMTAEVFTKANDFPAALKVYHNLLDRLEEKHPKIFEVYKNMGNLYLKCGDVDAAEEKYNLANAINNQDENLIVNYGVLAIQKEEYDVAKARFAQALNINQGSDLAWVGLGLVHRAHADHELARACILRGLDENPYNKLAMTNYYQWCYQDGVDASESFIQNYLEKHPNDEEMSGLARGMHQ